MVYVFGCILRFGDCDRVQFLASSNASVLCRDDLDVGSSRMQEDTRSDLRDHVMTCMWWKLLAGREHREVLKSIPITRVEGSLLTLSAPWTDEQSKRREETNDLGLYTSAKVKVNESVIKIFRRRRKQAQEVAEQSG